MAQSNTINLIQTKTAISGPMGLVIDLLRKLSLWSLVGIFGIGVIITGVFYYVKIRTDQLVSTQQQLSQVIAQNATKEGLLAAVKHQVTLTSKIMGVQQPVGKLFGTLSTFIPDDRITKMTFGDSNQVVLIFQSPSVTDVISIVDAFVKQSTIQGIRAPQLMSLSIENSGNIDVTLAFNAIF
jgi:hypothetical protein